MQYMCISMSAGMLLVMFIFHDLVGSYFVLFLFLFPQKEKLILLLPFYWLAVLSTY